VRNLLQAIHVGGGKDSLKEERFHENRKSVKDDFVGL